MERSIGKLAKLGGRVYVYLADEETGMKFLHQAEMEGFTFADGVRPAERHYSELMAVNHDGTLNYVGTNGHIAYGSGACRIGGERLIRIDFREYSDQK